MDGEILVNNFVYMFCAIIIIETLYSAAVMLLSGIKLFIQKVYK